MRNLTAAAIAMICSTLTMAQTIDFNGLQDMKNAQMRYFNEHYKDKLFSDTGVVEKYAESGRLFAHDWYVQMQGRNDLAAYCIVGKDANDPALKKLQQDFPVGTHIRMSGKIIEFVDSDGTFRLQDNCSIKR